MIEKLTCVAYEVGERSHSFLSSQFSEVGAQLTHVFPPKTWQWFSIGRHGQSHNILKKLIPRLKTKNIFNM